MNDYCLLNTLPESYEMNLQPPTQDIPRLRPPAQRLGSRIRICHVSMCLATGGLERLLVEFARRTNPANYEVMFVALGLLGRPGEEIRALGHQVISLAHQPAKGRWAKVRTLSRLFYQQQIDVVHSHNTYAHFYSAAAAKLAGTPVVINTQHGRGCGQHWKQRLHFFLANRFTDRILAVSEDSARLCRSQDPCSSKKIEALWNGIDLTRFSYQGPVRKPHAISVARLSPEKDFPTLLQATRYVVDRVPEFRLKIVGDGSERAALESLVNQLELNHHVEFLGERKDVPELLKQAAMFVSSTSTEGISLTLLEAMAIGLPIITTSVGGNPEVVQDGETGYLVPAGSPSELGDAICKHLQRPDMWDAMGTLARDRVERQFDINRMIREYEELYASLTLESRHKV